MKNIFLMLLGVLFVFSGCGDAPVEVDESNYEPKIVIEGYLIHGKAENSIRISRNFALNQEIKFEDFVISDAMVEVVDLTKNESFAFRFNPQTLAYEYTGGDLVIEYGHSYRLNVSATVDNTNLEASSTTTVPEAGFRIEESASVLGQLKYREKDAAGEVKNFQLAIQRSPGTSFYAISMVALDADYETFATENPYGLSFDDVDEADRDDLLQDLKHEQRWIQTQANGTGMNYFDVSWLDAWFYGKYRAIVYAGDDNFKNYFLTHADVQDIDGNLYEPKFNIEGDGIGVFGSAIADTVFYEVLKN